MVTHPEKVAKGHFRICLGARHGAFEKQFNRLLRGKAEPTPSSKGNFKETVSREILTGAQRGSF